MTVNVDLKFNLSKQGRDAGEISPLRGSHIYTGLDGVDNNLAEPNI